MSNALSLFDSPAFAIPAHLQDLNDEGNIADRQTTPSLSYEGKVWTISVNGEKTKLMKRDADGDEMPVAVMRERNADAPMRPCWLPARSVWRPGAGRRAMRFRDPPP